MKNVYSGAYQVDPNNFRLDIWYNNPSTSIDINYIPKPGVDDKLLIQLLDLDRLNQQQQLYQDGLFDLFLLLQTKEKLQMEERLTLEMGGYILQHRTFGKLETKMLAEGISLPL